jgi:uncharacterized protein (DUF1684 family)
MKSGKRSAGLLSGVRALVSYGAMVGVFAALASAYAAGPAAVTSAAKSDSDLARWRAERARSLSAPDGWLTLVGLEWLKPGKNLVGLGADSSVRLKGHAPEHLGVIDLEGNQLRLIAPPEGFPAHLLVDGQPAKEGPIRPDDEKASVISADNLTLVVLHRGDRYALRIKDALSPTRTSFRGLHWYAPNPAYRVTAKWIPFNPPHIEKIPTAIGTTLDMPAPGLAEVTLKGKTVQIEPVLESPDSKELFFILRDSTSHTTTYEASRFLYSGLPDHGLDQPGTVVLDFNRLQNPPCAYTPYATCPMPPYINRLAIAIEAGEQRYSH